MRANKPTVRVMLILPFLLSGIAACAQAKQRLLPPSPAERAALERKLDPALMPAGASHRKIDPKQIFKLAGPHGTELTIAAVDFEIPNPNAGVLRHTCGMYMVPAQGSAYFLDATSDDDDLPVQCWKIVSVRLVRKDAEPPEIVFVGEASLTSHSWRQEYVLHKGEDGIYKLSADYKDAPQEQ
jgi:hypothetical protein